MHTRHLSRQPCRAALAVVGVLDRLQAVCRWRHRKSSRPSRCPTRCDGTTSRVDSAAHRLFVAHRERVDVIDTRDNKPVLQFAPTPGVHGAAAASDLNRIFTSNGANGTVGVFDATTGKLLQTLKAGKNPDAIVYEPVTQRVFAFNGDSSDVTAIDARSLKVLGTIPAPGSPEFAVVDGHGRVYFNVEDKGELAVIDAQNMKVERHYSLAPCEEPSGLAIDPKGRLYSVCRNGVMVVSDPARGTMIGHAPVGHGPDGVAWLDGKAYSANGRDGTITVVAEVAEGRFEAIATSDDRPWSTHHRRRPRRTRACSRQLPTSSRNPRPPRRRAAALRPSPARSACWC